LKVSLFPFGFCSSIRSFGIRSQLHLFSCSWLPVLWTALGHATTWAETLQTAYKSSQRELEELRSAALETCQEVEEGEAQAGSSLASRLCALGGHVSRRMRRALHLGVKKALGVVRSHYEVNLEAVASGYIVPEGVEDKVAMEHVDALAADAAETLTEDFMEFLFPDAPDAGERQPCDHWALGPFFVEVLEFGLCGRVNKQVFCLDVQTLFLVSLVALFCFSFAWVNSGWGSSIS
jgi:hypothetical protein